jgi:Zn-dependent alcohol dehydrogenase
LAVIEGSVLAKASRIIAVDTNPEKFEIAKKWYESKDLAPVGTLQRDERTVNGLWAACGSANPKQEDSSSRGEALC